MHIVNNQNLMINLHINRLVTYTQLEVGWLTEINL